MPSETVYRINLILSLLFTLCYAYQYIYMAAPFFVRDRPAPPAARHRYAVLIAARNEELVIGPLLDSIRRQDYPQELVTTFVVADNCTDATGRLAWERGAEVYYRRDRQRVGKGYALDYLLRQVKQDYGDCFDGYFVFDADNLLEPDYISRMNETFSQGYQVVTSCRNSKNFGSNWISAGYALWFLRESEFLNHARMLLGTSCAVSGTGFLFSRQVLARQGGWPFHLLTEDIQFTAACLLAGERIGYCPQAVFYDEQPVDFGQSWRQRLRWARGYVQVLRHYGLGLLRGLFRKGGFACFDMLMSILPAAVLLLVGLAVHLYSALAHLRMGLPAILALRSVGGMLWGVYALFLVLGAVTTLSQWRRIYTSPWRKLLYTLTFPLFMLTYVPISLAALCRPVEWKPIRHSHAVALGEVRGTSAPGR